VDYLTGDDGYKKDWMSDRRERFGVSALNRRTVKGLALIARHFAARLVKRALRHQTS
jgi:CelD/BcsL family acetyltransferase involved in cellulose biosynthesis